VSFCTAVYGLAQEESRLGGDVVFDKVHRENSLDNIAAGVNHAPLTYDRTTGLKAGIIPRNRHQRRSAMPARWGTQGLSQRH
jgi:hypothetical protein